MTTGMPAHPHAYAIAAGSGVYLRDVCTYASGECSGYTAGNGMRVWFIRREAEAALAQVRTARPDDHDVYVVPVAVQWTPIDVRLNP